MKQIKQTQKLFVTALFTTSLILAEPSVYTQAQTDGLSISGNSNALYSIKQKLAQQKEEIEGLKSIIESLSKQLSGQSSQGGALNSDLESRIRSLETRVSNLEKILSSKGYLTQRVPTKSVSSNSARVTPSNKNSSYSSSLNRLQSHRLFSQGVLLVNKRRYQDAKKRFDILLKRRYKLASTNFYEGEIAYKTGRYSDAIKYYQRSAELNENSAYMDKLLLHTAISLDRLGEAEQAKNFFQAIIDGYPGTYSAKIAKRYLR